MPLRFGLLGVIVCLGCAPSITSRTAGSIGCPPDEIEISNESTSVGWGSKSKTWVASCRGHQFICSENTTYSSGNNSSGVDSDVACRAELSESESSNSGTASKSQATAPKAANQEPPKSAAGFEFGVDKQATRQACEAAGKSWADSSLNSGQCSGPAVDVGFDATVRIDFCKNRACRVVLVYQPESAWIKTLAELKAKLSQKYGSPETSTAGIPDGCRQEQEFVKCIEDESVHLKFEWSWATSEKIILTVGKTEESAEPAAIRLKYIVPQRAIQSSAVGL